MYLPLFPLSIFLLPGGVTRLRVFEQRYIQMIKNIEKTDGFVICRTQDINLAPKNNWGSWVELIDFSLGDDGILMVDVRCKGLVIIDKVISQDDGLLKGVTNIKPHWAKLSNDFVHDEDSQITLPSIQHLTDELKEIFKVKAKLYGGYYQYFEYTPNWICARWLELVPLSPASQDYFASDNTLDDGIEFLNTLITAK